MRGKASYSKLAAVFLLTAALLFAGCGLDQEIDSDFAGNYEQGMSGGLSDPDADEVWPESMPARIPEFEKGTVVNSNAIQVGGQLNIEVNLEEVKEEDLNDYIGKLELAGFDKQSSNDSGSIRTELLVEDGNIENAISLSYAEKTGELIITFSGT